MCTYSCEGVSKSTRILAYLLYGWPQLEFKLTFLLFAYLCLNFGECFYHVLLLNNTLKIDTYNKYSSYCQFQCFTWYKYQKIFLHCCCNFINARNHKNTHCFSIIISFSIMNLCVNSSFNMNLESFISGIRRRKTPKIISVARSKPDQISIYLLKLNNGSTKTMCKSCSKLTIKTSGQRQWSFHSFLCFHCCFFSK